MSESPSQPNPYLRTKVMTAGPAELRLMLFEAAVKHSRRARQGLAEKDYEAVYEGVTRCQSILIELINALDPDRSPDLCRKLSGLYTFMITRLLEATRQRSPDIVDEVIKLLEYERETSQLLVEKLSEPGDAPAAEGPVSVQA